EAMLACAATAPSASAPAAPTLRMVFIESPNKLTVKHFRKALSIADAHALSHQNPSCGPNHSCAHPSTAGYVDGGVWHGNDGNVNLFTHGKFRSARKCR